MSDNLAHLVVIGGPNGAGKSTSAPFILRGVLGVQEFVYADVIARGLSAFRPEDVAMEAGRIMLDRLRRLAERRVDFAFETTLAARSYAAWIRSLESQYLFHLVFFWLDSPELAIARVRERVASGGHNIPEDTVRQRYVRGVRNFFELYRPLAATWRVYDNSGSGTRELIASGGINRHERIYTREKWRSFSRVASATSGENAS